MVLLYVITFGLYFPMWFLRSRGGLNKLGLDRIGSARPVTLIALWILSFVIGTLSGSMRAEEPAAARELETAGNLLILPFGIVAVVLAFKVKGILEDYFQTQLSGGATFFLHIFYLQHKINSFLSNPAAAVAQRPFVTIFSHSAGDTRSKAAAAE